MTNYGNEIIHLYKPYSLFSSISYAISLTLDIAQHLYQSTIRYMDTS